MNINELHKALEAFRSKKVLVIGDVMVDHYLWGTVERISPEAPVPVVDVDKEEYRLGGAANVALNIKSLGATPYLLGITGNDRYHQILSSLLDSSDISSDYLLSDSERPTTLKSRIIAHGQHIIRIDNETKDGLGANMIKQILSLFLSLIDGIDCIILQDYNKGLLASDIITAVIETANKRNVEVAVDPKFKNFFEYRNCTIFKPNINELQKNSGIPIDCEENMDKAACKILDILNPTFLVVTRGEKGLSIYQKDVQRIDIPTFAHEIFDVSGAGDTVISTISLGHCSGLGIEEAALIANHAAGTVCSKVGIHPVLPEDIIKSLNKTIS